MVLVLLLTGVGKVGPVMLFVFTSLDMGGGCSLFAQSKSSQLFSNDHISFYDKKKKIHQSPPKFYKCGKYVNDGLCLFWLAQLI